MDVGRAISHHLPLWHYRDTILGRAHCKVLEHRDSASQGFKLKGQWKGRSIQDNFDHNAVKNLNMLPAGEEA